MKPHPSVSPKGYLRVVKERDAARLQVEALEKRVAELEATVHALQVELNRGRS